jgi:hypothetical protein
MIAEYSGDGEAALPSIIFCLKSSGQLTHINKALFAAGKQLVNTGQRLVLCQRQVLGEADSPEFHLHRCQSKEFWRIPLQL